MQSSSLVSHGSPESPDSAVHLSSCQPSSDDDGEQSSNSNDLHGDDSPSDSVSDDCSDGSCRPTVQGRSETVASIASSHMTATNLTNRLSIFRGSRLRMRAFLEHLLDTNEVAGLQYVNREEKIFQMPWKHAKSTAYDPDRDGKLFKLWGLNTGTLRPEDVVGFGYRTIWKVNFRCALRNVQNTIVEVGDGPVDGDYKTYQFKDAEFTADEEMEVIREALPGVPTSPGVQPQITTRYNPGYPEYQCRGNTSAVFSTTQQRKLGPCSPLPSAHPAHPMQHKLFAGGDAASGHSLSSLALHEDMPATSTNKAYIDFSAYVDVAATGNTHLQTSGGAPQSATHPSMTTPAMRSPAAMNVSSASAMSDAETSLALWQATGGAFGGLNDLSTTNFAMDTSVAIPPNTDQSALGLSTFFSPLSFFGHQLKEQDNLISYEMYIKVAYRGCAMAAMRIAHRDGCRLFYGSPPPRNTLDVATQERLFGPRKLMQLSLPAPRTAQSMLQSMWMVLEATQRGLILEMENNDIYATRLCCACVYFANQEGEVVALKRKERTQIFCFATFQKTYQRYKDPHHSHRLVAGEAPCYEVLMSIGQHWGEERHRDNNLISLNITHSLGEKMIESLRQEFFKNQNPFDTDYMSVDEMDEDDKRAKAALAAALQGTLHKSLESTSNHAASRNRGAGPKPAASMRKSKEKRQQSKQLARSVRQPPIPIPAK